MRVRKIPDVSLEKTYVTHYVKKEEKAFCEETENFEKN